MLDQVEIGEGRVKHDFHGDVGSPPQDVRDELLRRGGPHADSSAADPQVTGRANCQPVEHPGSLTLHSEPKSPIYSMKAFAYDASKTALNAFTVHLAHELRLRQSR